MDFSGVVEALVTKINRKDKYHLLFDTDELALGVKVLSLISEYFTL